MRSQARLIAVYRMNRTIEAVVTKAQADEARHGS